MTELSKEAQNIIDAARGHGGPNAADKARVLAKLKAAAAAAPTTKPLVTAKLTLMSIAVVAAATAAWLSRPVSLPSESGLATKSPPIVLPPPSAELPHTSVVLPAEEPQKPQATQPAKKIPPKVVAVTKPIAPVEAVIDAPAEAHVEAPAEAPVEAPVDAPANAPSEVDLLRDARLALRDGNAARALELAADHERLFRDSTLTEERLATRALAACTIGQFETADQAIAELSAKAPSSEHLARIQRTCAAARKRGAR